MTEQERFEQWAKPDPVQARTTEEGDYFDRGMVAAWNGWMAAKRDAADEIERLCAEIKTLQELVTRLRAAAERQTWQKARAFFND